MKLVILCARLSNAGERKANAPDLHDPWSITGLQGPPIVRHARTFDNPGFGIEADANPHTCSTAARYAQQVKAHVKVAVEQIDSIEVAERIRARGRTRSNPGRCRAIGNALGLDGSDHRQSTNVKHRGYSEPEESTNFPSHDFDPNEATEVILIVDCNDRRVDPSLNGNAKDYCRVNRIYLGARLAEESATTRESRDIPCLVELISG
jgi:hypothetical protein